MANGIFTGVYGKVSQYATSRLIAVLLTQVEDDRREGLEQRVVALASLRDRLAGEEELQPPLVLVLRVDQLDRLHPAAGPSAHSSGDIALPISISLPYQAISLSR